MGSDLRAAKEGMRKIRAANKSREELNKQMKGKSSKEKAEILKKLQRRKAK